MSGKNEFVLKINRAALNKIREESAKLPPMSNHLLALDRDDFMLVNALKAFENYIKTLAIEPNFKVVIYEQEG